ncbi:uncharacterized protein LOC120141632 [Hibiscus syriacus]|uniref:uncharacterized protein LOC120141632 n=1 Tax=Hibiscus syriacus TaxID=106335 RepID=UPI00192162A9|nr:uncharacterized protein LOC120141632 [Hibiscus syriacus]
MKQMKLETDSVIDKPKLAIPPPPPPPPPLPRSWARKTSADSVTNREIAKFWRQKHAEEEDHLLAAIKAAARKRARNLSEEDYKSFEESLSDEEYNAKQNITAPTNDSKGNDKNNEVRVGIKDWWTNSKYAYLNQPAVESTDNRRRRASTYIPNFLNYKPAPLYPTSLGVF